MADIWDQAAQAQPQPSAQPSGGSNGDIWDQAASQGGGQQSGVHPLDSAAHAISNWWDQVKHGPANLYDVGKGIAGLATGDTEKAMGQQNADLWNKAKDAYSKGDYLGAAAHTLNYALNGIPGVGSALDDAGESFKNGDVSGGVGKTLGLASNLVVGAKMPELATDAANLPAKMLGNTKLPERMYQSALKPSTRIPRPERGKIIQTGLNEGIPVSGSGLQETGSRIDSLNNDIAGVIKPYAAQGDTIDPNAVATRVNQIKPTFANQVNPKSDLAALDSSKEEFLTKQGAKPGVPAGAPQSTGVLDAHGQPIMNQGTPEQPPTPAQPMPVDEAQAVKQGTYKQVRKSYGTLSNAQVEAQKALARGIKEELAAKYPELDGLNARDGDLLKLQDSISKAVARIDNHQLFGIGTPLAAGAGAAVTGSPAAGLVIGAVRGLLDQPEVKSNLAIAMRKATTQPAASSGGLTGAQAARGFVSQTATQDQGDDTVAQRMGRAIAQGQQGQQ